MRQKSITHQTGSSGKVEKVREEASEISKEFYLFAL